MSSADSNLPSTPLDLAFVLLYRRQLLEKAAKAATKTHKDRVAEFNTKLENMSEHYDLPRSETIRSVEDLGRRTDGAVSSQLDLAKTVGMSDCPFGPGMTLISSYTSSMQNAIVILFGLSGTHSSKGRTSRLHQPPGPDQDSESTDFILAQP